MLQSLLLLPLASSIALTSLAVTVAPCETNGTRAAPAPSAATWSHWGVNVHNTRFQDGGASGLSAREVPRLKLKWAFSLGEVASARSQPAVASGRLFVGSEAGNVYAIDAESGCTWWTFRAGLPVRTGMVVAPSTPERPATIFFGDIAANVHAVDAGTGEKRWKVRVDDHAAAMVTGTPQFYRGVLYVPVSSYESVLPLQPSYGCCTFRGSVVALDAATGAVLWKTYTIDDAAQPTTKSKSGAQMSGPSGAAVWSTPTIDEQLDRIYFGTGNNYSEPTSARSDAVVALDRATGKIVWSRQFAAKDAYNSSCDIPGKANCPDADGPDADFGQPPILVSLPGGRRALVLGQKSGVVHALDPDREGEALWDVTVGPGGKLGGVHWGSAADSRNIYAALGGQEMTVVGDTTVKEGYRLVPDPKKGGGLFALSLATGKLAWSAPPIACSERANCSPAQSAAVTVIPGVVFSGALDGHLRAYSTATGAIIWDMDTARDYQSVNGGGGRAHGGALDVAGPVVVGRMLYVLSGYALFGGMPGNVLLAFSVDGK